MDNWQWTINVSTSSMKFRSRGFQIRAFLWWGRCGRRKERKKPKICTIYRTLVQIASFSLPHPTGAPSSEGAASLQAPTVDYSFYNIESAYTGRTGSEATEKVRFSNFDSEKTNKNLDIHILKFGITRVCGLIFWGSYFFSDLQGRPPLRQQTKR